MGPVDGSPPPLLLLLFFFMMQCISKTVNYLDYMIDAYLKWLYYNNFIEGDYRILLATIATSHD